MCQCALSFESVSCVYMHDPVTSADRKLCEFVLGKAHIARSLFVSSLRWRKRVCLLELMKYVHALCCCEPSVSRTRVLIFTFESNMHDCITNIDPIRNFLCARDSVGKWFLRTSIHARHTITQHNNSTTSHSLDHRNDVIDESHSQFRTRVVDQ